MTLQEEPEAEAKNLLLPHLCLKETIIIIQQANAFPNFYCHQKENISKNIFREMYDLKASKKL